VDLAGVLVDLNDMSFVIAVCLTHRVLPRWPGWFGLISGLLALIKPASSAWPILGAICRYRSCLD